VSAPSPQWQKCICYREFGDPSESVLPIQSSISQRFKLTPLRADSSQGHVPSNSFEIENNFLSELDSQEPSIVRKPRSIRILRLGRCYVDFGWSPSTRRVPKIRDNATSRSHKKRRQTSELSADPIEVGRSELLSHPVSPVRPLDYSIRELPDQASMDAAVLEKDAVYELESTTFGGFDPRDIQMNISDNAFDTNKSSFGKWNTPSVYTMRQASPLAAPHYSLPRIITQEHYETPPSLASANSSHNPSPISPVTPSIETRHGVSAHQHIVSPIAAPPTSHQPFQHATERSPIEKHFHGQNQGGLYFPEPISSFASPTSHFLNHSKPIPKDGAYDDRLLSCGSGLVANNWTSYPQFDPIPLSAGSSETMDDLLWDTNECYTEDVDPPAYTFQTFSEPVSGVDGCAIPQSFDSYEKSGTSEHDFSHSVDSLQQETTDLHLYITGAIHRRGAIRGRALPAACWPAKRCNICGSEFTGQ
jgi:hypothetical protein